MNTEKEYNPLLELEKAFGKINSTGMYSVDLCCKLLSYLFVYGGNNEEVITNKAFYFAVRTAQEKANIKGGEIPNQEYVSLITKYSKELKDGMWHLIQTHD